MSVMNKHQQEALDRCYELLAEHFEAFAITVSGELEDAHQEFYKTIYKGGAARAAGMLDFARHELISEFTHPPKGEEE